MVYTIYTSEIEIIFTGEISKYFLLVYMYYIGIIYSQRSKHGKHRKHNQ